MPFLSPDDREALVDALMPELIPRLGEFRIDLPIVVKFAGTTPGCSYSLSQGESFAEVRELAKLSVMSMHIARRVLNVSNPGNDLQQILEEFDSAVREKEPQEYFLFGIFPSGLTDLPNLPSDPRVILKDTYVVGTFPLGPMVSPVVELSLHEKCYRTNNRYAYFFDSHGEYQSEGKWTNFVPTYDPWCLACGRQGVTRKCSRCKFVYFCGVECQRKAWPVHKQHCGRDLFCLCAQCGSEHVELTCSRCPVKYCSVACRDQHQTPHREYGDCQVFAVLKN